ncbi:flagellar hook-basal body complex protein FliE [Nocardioides pantholopis]|uniref:flagellar hook-basal body complex protein FliE n=1 Tax=Nocardioides pantholopis TaxID=2483798 RepID=UPI000F077214|nr:flagellar hook-basal body complex protein FliE [Nocardioides pantholopis]
MSVAGIEGFAPLNLSQIAATDPATRVVGPGGTEGVQGAQGPDFASLLTDGIERLDGVQKSADTLAVQAATGDLQNIHDYTLAAAEAQATSQVTVAVRNKAIEAFTEILRMQV